jgi:hypothetical protein
MKWIYSDAKERPHRW